ncbi:unnamed protein product [Rhizophagus irregularis]|uniref:Uncharacterized protein n=1 Tax=Rhizophagus irregularis TaxID=588596 RepID=A0A2N1NKZ2_9GLOM|nr:hypothetical protein RhiirC2_846740 [Rhizophagus irregularis]CAB4385005.1 unnamed protein product [Rhizophagus irregularis]
MNPSIFNKCKKYSCICQRYRPKENVPNECLYCHHSIGYHETSTTIDTTEYPYGSCNQIQCGCQRFKYQSLGSLFCIHCNHYDGFHSDWPLKTNNNPSSANNISSYNNLSLLSQVSPITSTNVSAMSLISSQVNTIPTNNRSQRSHIPAKPAPYKSNSNRRAGRNPATILNINVIICFNQEIPNRIPKFDSPFWNDLNSRNLIKNNIKISNNSSSGKLRKVVYNEITCDLIRQNITKTKKMYIAPDTLDTFDIGLNSAIHSENTSPATRSEANPKDSLSTSHPENTSFAIHSEIQNEISILTERNLPSTTTINDDFDSSDWLNNIQFMQFMVS